MLSDTRSPAADLVRRFCGSWGSGEVDQVVGYLSSDVEWENVPIGILRGRESARERIAAAFAAARSIRWELLTLGIASDGAVLTERLDVIDTGSGDVRIRIMGLFRVGPGGILLWRDYFDGRSYSRDLAFGSSAVDV